MEGSSGLNQCAAIARVGALFIYYTTGSREEKKKNRREEEEEKKKQNNIQETYSK